MEHIVVKPVKGFRLDEDLIKSLKEIGNQKDLTLHALVKNILEKYSNSYYYLEQFHYQHVSPEIMKEITCLLTEPQLKKIAKRFAKDLESQIMFSFIEYNHEEIMQLLIRNFGIQITLAKKETNSKKVKYKIFHNLDESFSKLLKYILDELAPDKAKQTVTCNKNHINLELIEQ